jgi:hypothetical protein
MNFKHLISPNDLKVNGGMFADKMTVEAMSSCYKLVHLVS